MATSFDFSIQNDFPNQAVDLSVLTAEIEAGGGSSFLDSINVDGDTLTVETNVDLTAPQETALNNVIANHQGQGFVEGIQTIFVENEQLELGNTFSTKASLASGILKSGYYLVGWYGESSVLLDTGNSACIVSVRWNGTERASDFNSNETYRGFSGSIPLEVNDLDAPVLDVQIRRAGLANTARCRRIRLSITPILANVEE